MSGFVKPQQAQEVVNQASTEDGDIKWVAYLQNIDVPNSAAYLVARLTMQIQCETPPQEGNILWYWVVIVEEGSLDPEDFPTPFATTPVSTFAGSSEYGEIVAQLPVEPGQRTLAAMYENLGPDDVSVFGASLSVTIAQ